MKQLLLFALAACLTIQVAVAQLGKVPSEVTNAFAAKYPDAKNVQWKDNVKNFSAKFTSSNDNKCVADFNGKGEWQSTEEELDEAELPAAVKDGFSKSKYSDRKVSERIKIEKKGGDVQYRLLSKKNDVEKKYLFFSKDGKLLKESVTL